MANALKTVILFSVLASGCGYTLRGQERPFFDRKQIRTVYIPPVKNDSYRPGVEIMVYNTMRKRFNQWGYVKIVDDPKQADATLQAAVDTAGLAPQAMTRASGLATATELGPPNVEIATGYNVTLGIRFVLVSAKNKNLWAGSLSRSKPFQAATYIGALGTTSALINESQFDDTLAILATSVISDAEESINAIF